MKKKPKAGGVGKKKKGEKLKRTHKNENGGKGMAYETTVKSNQNEKRGGRNGKRKPHSEKRCKRSTAR